MKSILVISDDPKRSQLLVKWLEPFCKHFFFRSLRFSVFKTKSAVTGPNEEDIQIIIFDVGDNRIQEVASHLCRMIEGQHAIVLHGAIGPVQGMFSLYLGGRGRPKGHFLSNKRNFARVELLDLLCQITGKKVSIKDSLLVKA